MIFSDWNPDSSIGGLLKTPFLISIAALAFLISTHVYSGNIAAGKCMSYTMYWQSSKGIQLDTLNWENIESIYDLKSGEKAPVKSIKKFNEKQFRIFRLKHVTPISLALLYNCGYNIYCLTQWFTLPSGHIKVSARGMEDTYKEQKIMTDKIWEIIDNVKLSSMSKIADDYKILLYYRDAGYCEGKGNEDLLIKTYPIYSSTIHFGLHFLNGMQSDEIVQRQVFAVYIISKSDVDKKKIEKDLGNEMDKMRLDISYTFPEIIELK